MNGTGADMRPGTFWLRPRAIRMVAAWGGLVSLLVLQPEPMPIVELASARETRSAGTPGELVLSDQAQRFLALQYRSYPTEFMGCMIGHIRGGAVVVERIAPADVEPSKSRATWVIPKQTCEEAGWKGTVGMIHSHVTAQKCWYYFPGTTVPSSDGQSFMHSPYPVDAIMCGARVVWISRSLVQKQVALAEDSQGMTAVLSGGR